ncbi:MAG: tetratricopeptide repeat protein [Acidobacteriota bacterium]|nr:tetratricopeptide repeat protein [Acidobacteriota bacterium]
MFPLEQHRDPPQRAHTRANALGVFFASSVLVALLTMADTCSLAQNAGPAASSSQGTLAEGPLVEAQKSFAEKRYTQAAEQSGSIAEHAADPQLRLAALSLQAKSLINAGDFPAAETVLQRYLVPMPQSPEALYLLGYVLERENKARESLAVYTRAAALAPPAPNDLKLVALDYVLLHDFPDAIQWLNRSLAGDPRNAEAWYFLGRAHMQGGDFVEAEKDFRHALDLDPKDAKAHDNLGLSLEAQNRNNEAARAYTDAINVQKGQSHESEQPLLNLGTLWNNENRSREALPYLKRAVELAPGNARCFEQLSRAFSATADPAQAIRAMQQAVALDHENPRLHFLLGQLFRNAGQTANANTEFATSKRLYGSHSTETHP